MIFLLNSQGYVLIINTRTIMCNKQCKKKANKVMVTHLYSRKENYCNCVKFSKVSLPKNIHFEVP